MAEPIPLQVRDTVLRLEPEAEVVLYGSRARGDASAESDWDFLILLPGEASEGRKDQLRHALYEIELAVGELVSSIIVSQENWDDPKRQAAPFFREVAREGVAL